jgi:hypothetical protein
VRLVIYLDDFLILNHSRDGLLNDLKLVLDLLQGLGFLINWEKSICTPQQLIEFLGLMIDSRSLSISLPESKVGSIKTLCLEVLAKESFTLESSVAYGQLFLGDPYDPLCPDSF